MDEKITKKDLKLMFDEQKDDILNTTKEMMFGQKEDMLSTMKVQKNDILSIIKEQKDDILSIMKVQKDDILSIIKEQKDDILSIMKVQKEDILEETKKNTQDSVNFLLEAMNFGFEEARKERGLLRKSINRIENTLDSFVNRLTTLEDEFVIVKAENVVVRNVIKDKLGVEISLSQKS